MLRVILPSPDLRSRSRRSRELARRRHHEGMDVDHSDRPAGPFQPTWIVLGAAYGLTVVTVSADPGQRSAVAGLVLALVVAVVVFPGDRRPGGRLVGGGLVMLSGTAVVLLG